MEKVTIADIQRMAETGEIMGFVTHDGTRYNTFINSSGKVSYFTGKNSRRKKRAIGFTLEDRHLKEFKRFIKERANESDRVKFRLMNKLGKMMLESSDDNRIVNPLRTIPKTYNEWLESGKKSLSDLGFGDGSEVVGEVIKGSTIGVEFPEILSGFYSSYYLGEQSQSANFKFRGFSTHLITWLDEEDKMVGELVRVYKNGTIIKYILINIDFVGYSKTLGY